MIRLGVNIDHVATLREARKEGVPDIKAAAAAVKAGGADSITVHLRQDRRHIQDSDVCCLSREGGLPLNLEMAAVDEITAIALEVKPESVCLVPEKRQELTTEGGLDVTLGINHLKNITAELKSAGIEVSMFVDPDEDQLNAVSQCEADTVELHTGSYALAPGEDERMAEIEKISYAVKYALGLGIKVNAGHGLTYENVPAISHIQGISDLNIGYSIICESVFIGLEAAVRRMKELLA